jgi:hypothetical protein
MDRGLGTDCCTHLTRKVTMAIERKHKSANFITQPGEYLVEVIEVNATRSKSGKPMCTVTFETPEGSQIKGYYVGELKFHMAALSDCKKASGINPNAPATNMVGKKLGIAVDAGKQRDDGSHFMSITGYGTVAELMAEAAVKGEIAAPKHSDMPPPPPVGATQFAGADDFSDVPF